MNKPKLVLTPVGALIVNRLTQDEKPLWDSVQKEDLLAIREGQAKGQEALEQKVVTRLKTLNLNSEEGLQQASPEIKSLAKIGIGPEDQIVLYASETPDGILSARIVHDFAEQVWECTSTLEVITGLQVKDAGRFRSVGVLRYVQSIVKLIDNPNNRYGREIILNATAGYKSLVPYTTLVGLLFQVQVQYIFETSSELLSLPPLPLDFDQQFFKQVEPLSASCSTRNEKNCMSDEARLFDTNILVHAYTISDERKHAIALALVERVWAGEEAATTLQNLCELFFVVTRKVAKPIAPAAAESVLRGILLGSQWTVFDRTPGTVFKAIEFVRLSRTHFWDALIAACRLEHGVHTIVAENERDFKKIPGLTIINPFKRVRPV